MQLVTIALTGDLLEQAFFCFFEYSRRVFSSSFCFFLGTKINAQSLHSYESVTSNVLVEKLMLKPDFLKLRRLKTTVCFNGSIADVALFWIFSVTPHYWLELKRLNLCEDEVAVKHKSIRHLYHRTDQGKFEAQLFVVTRLLFQYLYYSLLFWELHCFCETQAVAHYQCIFN